MKKKIRELFQKADICVNLIGIFKKLSKDVRSNEEGNIFYQVAKDRENENTYIDRKSVV